MSPMLLLPFHLPEGKAEILFFPLPLSGAAEAFAPKLFLLELQGLLRLGADALAGLLL